MTPRIILVPLTGAGADEPVMAIATELAARFNAHVTALHVRTGVRRVIPLPSEGASVPLIERIAAATRAEIEQVAARARDVFTTACRIANIEMVADAQRLRLPSALLHDEAGSADAFVVRYGRVADLIVAAQPTASGPETLELALDLEAALFGTARPVLLAPPDDERPPLVGGPVAIAWNGSAQAARAVAASFDFLHASSAVTAIAVDEGREGGALDPLIDYLAWHGVSAQAVLLPPGRSGVGAQILAEAASRAAGLLVMGAYTRSRLRERVLGGATRHVIAKATIPVLMAH
jgi:nucleotide-binding universal stress UspA family protein